MIMEFLGQPVEYPIKVHCDNVGATYLAYNEKISRRTKNVDARMHIVRRYMEDGTIKIVQQIVFFCNIFETQCATCVKKKQYSNFTTKCCKLCCKFSTKITANL